MTVCTRCALHTRRIEEISGEFLWFKNPCLVTPHAATAFLFCDKTPERTLCIANNSRDGIARQFLHALRDTHGLLYALIGKQHGDNTDMPCGICDIQSTVVLGTGVDTPICQENSYDVHVLVIYR